jgi:hypothetical protein
MYTKNIFYPNDKNKYLFIQKFHIYSIFDYIYQHNLIFLP